MAPIIEGGNVITGGVVDPHTAPGARTFYGTSAPTSGVSGTYANQAQAGDLYVNNGSDDDVYENQGTLASPTWVRVDTLPV